ncbi:helix-turn-helix transcriptional regulator [Bacillus sp. RG28]|uniref:Helix-turn-helix transcriptional regulator n=1 Tax=Gottfriedia endophytica TaxID=2820819 RepID=A0A940NDM2_9BACI|nr:helix-turn-helix transcriptional regulator [Gottfriedia endophytica]MBP0723579.1 helix-turn-helix transcriptional regulator [Gottfriedia endophytica]
MIKIELTKRQEQIIEIVKNKGPITGENIADLLDLTRATLRPDLAILTMIGYLEARPRVGYYFTGKTNDTQILEKIKKLSVEDFQSIPVVVDRNSSVYDAVCAMFLEDVGTLFVVDQNSVLVGVLSRKDLLRASIGSKDLQTLPVDIIMTRMPNITICYKEDSIFEVAKSLIEKQIDAVPVVRESPNGLEVVGRFTKTNFTRALVDIVQNKLY